MTSPMQITEKKKVPGNLTILLVGFVVVTGVGLLVAGSDMISLYLISVICTAGVAFAFWLPLWWVVGKCTLELFALRTKERSKSSADNAAVAPSLNPHQRATVDFIARSRELGWTDDQIRQQLKDPGGWTDAQIAEAFAWKG